MNTQPEPAGTSTSWLDWHHILLEMLLLSVTSLLIVPFILFASVHTLISLPRSPLFSVQVSSFTSSYSSSFVLILYFLRWLSLIFPPALPMSILADTASASSYATFHQPQHHLSIHLAVTQERPGLPTSVRGIEVDEVQRNIRNVFWRDRLSISNCVWTTHVGHMKRCVA